jgi:hypothetical protein
MSDEGAPREGGMVFAAGDRVEQGCQEFFHDTYSYGVIAAPMDGTA